MQIALTKIKKKRTTIIMKNQVNTKILMLCEAYEDAQENDYCTNGEYEGMRTGQIVDKLISEIRNLDITLMDGDRCVRCDGEGEYRTWVDGEMDVSDCFRCEGSGRVDKKPIDGRSRSEEISEKYYFEIIKPLFFQACSLLDNIDKKETVERKNGFESFKSDLRLAAKVASIALKSNDNGYIKDPAKNLADFLNAAKDEYHENGLETVFGSEDDFVRFRLQEFLNDDSTDDAQEKFNG